MEKDFLLTLTLIFLLFSCKPREIKNEIVEESSVVTCLSIIERILITSPYYKEYIIFCNDSVIAKGGKGVNYCLEASPDSSYHLKRSNTYDFAVFESYEDRIVIIDRISFDVRKKQLSKYDETENRWIPLSFDEKLLDALRQTCDCAYNYYYLCAEEGKIYRLDGSTLKREKLNLSDERILRFELSPDHRYMAFIKELEKSDRKFSSSLVIYDILKQEISLEYGGKNGFSVDFGQWLPEQSFTYSLINEKNEKKEFLKCSLIPIKTIAISSKEFYDFNKENHNNLPLKKELNDLKLKEMVEDGYSIIKNPYNDNWLLLVRSHSDLILYNKNKEQNLILEIKNDPLKKIHNIIWLDELRFLFAKENLSQQECRYTHSDIYIYDIGNKQHRLLAKNAASITPVYISEI